MEREKESGMEKRKEQDGEIRQQRKEGNIEEEVRGRGERKEKE